MNRKIGNIALSGLGVASHFGTAALANTQISENVLNPPNASETVADSVSERLVTESAWISVPLRCKDRSLSAEPRVIRDENVGQEMLSIHALIH